MDQLVCCLKYTTRWDIIKVNILIKGFVSICGIRTKKHREGTPHFIFLTLEPFKAIDFEQVDTYGELNKDEYVGFADAFLRLCETESKSDQQIDIQAYAKLVELDSKLGTSAAEQLFMCVYYSPRLELVKV